MTFLPIVDRELRVTARRPGIHRVRLAVALMSMFLAGIIFVVNLGAPQHQLGRHLFEGLSVFSILYCLFSGRISTADCLSEEKREGTLGLLFLTDLKGYDVVFGKLAATSVSTMLPSAVKAGPLVELSALSAERLLPPAGEVIMTSASTAGALNASTPRIRARSAVVFIFG